MDTKEQREIIRHSVQPHSRLAKCHLAHLYYILIKCMWWQMKWWELFRLKKREGSFSRLTSTWLPGIKVTSENPDQLSASCVWAAEATFDSSPSVLLSMVGPVAELDAIEELTPLDVLTELCWMASLWGLLGTDISSLLSSLSSTETEKQNI